MIYSGRPGPLDGRYRERPHHFYLHPVDIRRAGTQEFSGFYLVAFRDTSVERALIGHVFLSGTISALLVMSLIYGFGLAGPWIAARLRNHSWTAWLWPHGGLVWVYQRQTAAFALVLVGSFVAYFVSGSMRGFIAAPVLATVAGIAIYIAGARRKSPRTALSGIGVRWHLATIVLVLACLVIVPSFALFRVALSHEFAKAIRTEEAWISAQRQDVQLAVASEARAEELVSPLGTERVSHHRFYFACAPAPFHTPAEPDRPGATRPAVMRADADQPVQAAPPPDRSGVIMSPCAFGSDVADRGAAGAGAEALLVWTMYELGDRLPIQNELFARQHFQSNDLAFAPDAAFPVRPSAITYLAIGLLLAVLAWLIRWNTNQLFLADVTAGPPSDQRSQTLWNDCGEQERLILIQVARERIASPRHRETVNRLLCKGVLKLDPDIQPCSQEFAAFVARRERDLKDDVLKFERASNARGWRYTKIVLVASAATIGVFLFATQPNFQSNAVAIAGSIIGALTTHQAAGRVCGVAAHACGVGAKGNLSPSHRSRASDT